MSSLAADLLIWVLLAGGVGFSLLGFVGLLIFPDARSRMFTASRATLIGACLVTSSVVAFGVNGFLAGSIDLYAVFVIHVLFLFGILAFANLIIYRILLQQLPSLQCSPDTTGPVTSSKE